ncbi:MAG: S41 family peptidase [Solirubrobacterales bacterium]|nr:S41 family peptidase [Solirubrobacterales bacterium]
MSSRQFRRRPSAVRIAVLTVGAVILLGVGVWLGGHPGWMPSALRSAFVNDSGSRLMQDVVSLLQRDYYRPVNSGQLINKGIAGAVASLDDPYSHYFNPGDYHSFLNQSNPHLSGIGVDVLPDRRGLMIVAVFPGSPAARAGLTRGMVIVRVGTRSLAGRSTEFSSSLIRGPAGTKVTVTVVNGKRRHVFTMKRANIVIPVASGRVITYHGVKLGYLQLTSFTEDASAELRAAVRRVLRGGARGLILDLRENGGGLLDQAVGVASIFISDGTIVSTDGRAQPRQVYLAQGNAIATRQPTVVLVDRGTASAAEIVTAALKDRHRALVVGTRTYGKGVFQEIDPLPNGGALDFTVGEYFTPNGQNLGGGGVRRGEGVKPNIYAQDNPRARVDEALQAAERTVANEVR